MPVNNIGVINLENSHQRPRQNNIASTSVNSNVEYSPVSASMYHQYMLNTNYNISFERANENEEDMKAIYEMDQTAFADLDPYESYEEFKGYIDDNNISVYSLKDNTGEIIGYYNLEPVKDDDLYIDSIVLKPQYRNIKKGYAAIWQAWEKINDYAKENNVKTMSLHVDSKNQSLKKMYERFGFVEQEYIDKYYSDDNGAYYMVKTLDNTEDIGTNEAQEVSDRISEEVVTTEKTPPNDEIQTAETVSASEFDEEIYEEKIKDSRVLHDLKIFDLTPKFYLKGIEIIEDDEALWDIANDYNDGNSLIFESEKICSRSVSNIAVLKAISYRTYEEKINPQTGEKITVPVDNIDDDAEKFSKRLYRYTPLGGMTDSIDLMIASRCQKDGDSPLKFDREIYNKAIELNKNGVSISYLPSIIKSCMFKENEGDKEKIVFNDEMYNHILNESNKHQANIHSEKVFISVDEIDGKRVFNKDTFDYIVNKSIGYRYSTQKGGVRDFRNKPDSKDKCFDIALFEKFCEADQPEIQVISDVCNGEYCPNGDAIDAYKYLQDRKEEENWKYVSSDYNSNAVKDLIKACKISSQQDLRWNNNLFNHVIELLDKGYEIKSIVDLLEVCKAPVKGSHILISDTTCIENRYKFALSLMDKGVDITNAGCMAAWCIDLNGKDEVLEEKMLKLYELGSKYPVIDINMCLKKDSKEIDNHTYEKMLEVLSKGLESDLIPQCKTNNEFSDRLYHQALDLQKRGYSPHSITSLMKVCHVVENKNQPTDKAIFNQKIYNHIEESEKIGIDKENIADVLHACTFGKEFSEGAFSKVSELHNKQFDDKGVAKFIALCRNETKIDEYEYKRLLENTKRHTDLRDSIHGDDYIVNKIYNREDDIELVKELYGDDVVNYAVSMKIDGFDKFMENCANMYNKTIYRNREFNKNVVLKLKELPSPELKVKRLRILSALTGNVDDDSMNSLLKYIKSPEMTKEQTDLTNEIFIPEYKIENEEELTKTEKEELVKKEYEKRVNCFIDIVDTPKQYRKTVYDFLMKERLDKSIERPKSIEEQKEQMEKNAQQILANPKIPTDKKSAYVDEYKAKIKDMDLHPENYTKPYIYPKPLANLKKVVEAYINIPNDNRAFNNATKEIMYKKMKIEITPEILDEIDYDPKYFDKMFSTGREFGENFKALIELKKMNPGIPLNEARMIMPEKETKKYYLYRDLDLISQIKANLDTKRQFEEHSLLFDEWDNFDNNFRGETFTSEANQETEFKNLKDNVINIFNDEYWNCIKPEETQKLSDNLEKLGYKILDNELYKNGKIANKTDVENFINATVEYISKSEYWANAKPEMVVQNLHIDNQDENMDEQSQDGISGNEIVGISAFTDHIKGFQKRVNEIKNSKTINNIHFRLTDDNDIGRNIFFGNHVGCCNSVESSFAGYSAPMHLLNNYVRGLELVDEWGNSYGNSLCFFADVDDKLTFVIDSFEGNGKLGSNPVVAEKLFEFAKDVCKRMGREDAQIMVGPNYNNMDKSLLKLTEGHKIKVLGTVSEKTYCDSVGGEAKDKINNFVTDRKMHELK